MSDYDQYKSECEICGKRVVRMGKGKGPFRKHFSRKGKVCPGSLKTPNYLKNFGLHPIKKLSRV